MACDVQILLFDEPLANLDPATGKRTIALVDDIMKQENMTVVIIEHRLADVLYRDVDRVVLMEGGRIVADMHPDELLCTDLLINSGIREPLYSSALKNSGAKLLPESHPQHIETMDVEPYKERMRKWFMGTPDKTASVLGDELLGVRNLEFSYDEKRIILDDVSFSIKKGEMVALVGKNGAGKSTLASLICGFYQPTKGTISLKGKDMSLLSVKERGDKIGFCMQSPNQMISKPMIYDEVALGLKARNAPDVIVKEKVENILKICGLYPFRNWPVSALSFGQKKRVSIASILVMNPEMLILDEPTAGQDYRHYTEIMEFLKSIRETLNITIVMITHDMHLMLEYADRALVLADGKLIMDASPEEILTRDDICDKAYLKRTSLYDLAVKCGIEDTDVFVSRFIEDERSRRKGVSL